MLLELGVVSIGVTSGAVAKSIVGNLDDPISYCCFSLPVLAFPVHLVATSWFFMSHLTLVVNEYHQ